ncbi:MAG TPA: GNAT family N-acetyltransferase [Candidatus Acidoferrum sp.]|nr:GNAT family N-acetyltransferase [Candidatus Acidoferrum sp.]
MLTIRPAVAEDVPAVADLLEQVIEHLHRTGNNYPNWHHGKYPTPAVPAAAFARGDLYVAELDGEIVGTVTVNAAQAPQYGDMPWRVEAPPDKVRVIHTLATRPAARGSGLSRRLLAYAEELALRQGAVVMRLDTFHENAPARHIYEETGYVHIGYVDFADIRSEGEPYAIYEKPL